MVKRTTIAVIMPAYKSGAFIEEALNSVCLQLMPNPSLCFKVIVGVDNCVQTLTTVKELIPSYKNLEVYYFNDKTGPYIIRNTLARLADADHLVFFDADDIMPPGFLHKVCTGLHNKQMLLFYHANFIDVYTNGEFVKRSSSAQEVEKFRIKNALNYKNYHVKTPFFKKTRLAFKHGKMFKWSLYKNLFNKVLYKHLQVSGVFAIKQQIFMEMHGYKHWPVGADSEFVLRARKLKVKIGYLPQKFAFMRRIHEQSLTLDHDTGIGSEVRNYYIQKKEQPVTDNMQMVTSTNFKRVEL